ncbi:MAG: beta-ketoacyl synthase chain length factor [Caldimonas sp.]
MTAASTHVFYVEAVAFWAPTLPGWPIARAAFRGEGDPVDPPAKRPAPEVLAAAERRRAPDTVALALEVAAAAVAAAGLQASELPSIFTSAHGDLGVNDYMCRTLATQPTQISPTRFHNSVHNAAAGYWTIGIGCREASSALTAFDASFAAGLLEAATQCEADHRPVLLVAFDVEATGPLATVTVSQGLVAGALVLAPDPSERTLAAFEWRLAPGPSARTPLRSQPARAIAGNAMADALPFFEAVAFDASAAEPDAGTAELLLPLSTQLSLALRPRPFAARGDVPRA